MENYKKKLYWDNILTAILALILVAFMALAIAGEAGALPLTPVTGDSHWQSTWRGFCAGAAGGMLALMLLGLGRNLLAMRSAEKLKKLYIRQNDEREWEIYTKALCAAMRVCLLLSLVATVVVGYFNATAGVTLLCATFIASMICLGFKLYYRKQL